MKTAFFRSIILFLLWFRTSQGRRVEILHQEKDAGTCFVNANTTGICIHATECVVNFAVVRPNICSFDGITPVVCCPLLLKASSSFTSVERISSIKCGEFKNHTINKRSLLAQVPQYSDDIQPIVKGKPVKKLVDCPYMSRIGHNATTGIEFFCGGSLISEKFVLSAAHCQSSGLEKPANTVRLGYTDDYMIETFLVHPSYSSVSKHNDIALISLVTPVNFKVDAFPICLTQTDVDAGLSVSIFGYGQTSFQGVVSEILMKVDLQTINNEKCIEEYDSITDIIPFQVCAHDPQNSGKDACLGDSGGPMQTAQELVGVTSYGIACGTAIPGVYTKVYPYLDWIEKIVWS